MVDGRSKEGGWGICTSSNSLMHDFQAIEQIDVFFAEIIS